ncbi:MAG TPA: hypothetical protein VNI77_01985 [Nitrososphaera sp.]|nr:hypothetical protein [Nitrososphaera sp.]
MSALFAEEAPVPLSICPRCGRQIRIDGHCDCELIFFTDHRLK